MSSKLKVLQVIPSLDYGGAETGCYDLAHYLAENKVGSYNAPLLGIASCIWVFFLILFAINYF